jgi:hypothetical protein
MDMIEEIEKRLKQAQTNLSKYDPGKTNHTRLLGCMEMALVLLGKLTDGPLPYKTYKQDIGWFRTKIIERTESYSRMIQRECEEYFNQKNK